MSEVFLHSSVYERDFTALQFMSVNRILCFIFLRRLKSMSIITNLIRINMYTDIEL